MSLGLYRNLASTRLIDPFLISRILFPSSLSENRLQIRDAEDDDWLSRCFARDLERYSTRELLHREQLTIASNRAADSFRRCNLHLRCNFRRNKCDR